MSEVTAENVERTRRNTASAILSTASQHGVSDRQRLEEANRTNVIRLDLSFQRDGAIGLERGVRLASITLSPLQPNGTEAIAAYSDRRRRETSGDAALPFETEGADES
jgi:hypothetical protein